MYVDRDVGGLDSSPFEAIPLAQQLARSRVFAPQSAVALRHGGMIPQSASAQAWFHRNLGRFTLLSTTTLIGFEGFSQSKKHTKAR